MSSTGKIARLPHLIREQLNHRLLDNESAEPLLKWLNADPAVQKILADQFAAHPITPQNLSEWRTGAFIDWRVRYEFFRSSDDFPEFAKTLPAGLVESLSIVLYVPSPLHSRSQPPIRPANLSPCINVAARQNS